MYGRKNLVRGWGHCDSCGEYSRRKNYTGRKWGHLYYLPLVPCSGRLRVTHECGKCGYGFHLPAREVPALLASLAQTADEAMNLLMAGEDTIDDDGTPTPCVESLIGDAELFHGLGASERVEWIVTTLRDRGLAYAHAMVHGKMLELEGDLDGAQSLYAKAVADHPDDERALRAMGSVSLLTGDYERALDALGKVFELSEDREDRLGLRQIMIGLHEEMGDYDQAIEQYEQCFELSPKLAKDKKFKKAYNKACKKAQKLTSPYHS